MNYLKRVLTIIWGIFACFGILVVVGGIYFYVADPFHIKALFAPAPASSATQNRANTPQPASNSVQPKTAPAEIQLTPQQQTAANSLGINPSSISSFLTPATEQCAVTALGQDRVNQIKAGATPSPVDLVKAGHCLGK